MNRLEFETSPYLKQHKENPVNWYPWGEEAIEKARLEDKPIFLSIGYSACHWCHVMAHESFENQKIAYQLNRDFINIKVDREERPDVDNIYMNFVQLTTGSGGWPLSVFLSPDLVPFYGGTYFPPEDGYGRPGFSRILDSVVDLYKNKRPEILNQQVEIVEALKTMTLLTGKEREYSLIDFHKTFALLLQQYDEEFGGFGKAPKFPSSITHGFLLRYYYKTGNPAALNIVENSLRKMASGGIYDQVGGGFHRYATDNEWLVPHFEKMLYDNALLSHLFAETYQVTHDPYYLAVAEDILVYILREMTSPEGGFYSAQDADSSGREGEFFLWTYDELKELLDTEEFDLAAEYFQVTSQGNFEGKNILTAHKTAALKKTKLNNYDIDRNIAGIRHKLLLQREKRIRPGLDYKIITGWNALMLKSFSLLYGITGNDIYLQTALNNANYIWDRAFNDIQLFHCISNGTPKFHGFLDDYAFTSEAFIALYKVTSDELWLTRASKITELMIENFYDSKAGDFFYSPAGADDLIIRAKEHYDNAIPSGNSSAVFALQQLSVYMDNASYSQLSDNLINKMLDNIFKYPAGFSYMLSAALLNFNRPVEVAIIVKDDLYGKSIMHQFYADFSPFALLAIKEENKESELQIFQGKEIIQGKNTFFLCRNFACEVPVFSYEELKNNLHK